MPTYTTVAVMSSLASEGPYGGTWESAFRGYIASCTGEPLGKVGSISTDQVFGNTIYFVGMCQFEGNPIFMIGLQNDADETFFSTASVMLTGQGSNSYAATLTSAFYPTGSFTVLGLTVPQLLGPVWIWPDPNADFSAGVVTNITWSTPITAPSIVLDVPTIANGAVTLDWTPDDGTAGGAFTSYWITRNSATLATNVSISTSAYVDSPGPGTFTYQIEGVYEGYTPVLSNQETATISALPGHGDITDPQAWQDSLGNIPPSEFNQVPEDTNYPQNGDGRYWFNVNAISVDSGSPITFIGDPNFLIDTASLQWSVTSTATDGSVTNLAYSIATGTWTTVQLLPQLQLGGIQNGEVLVNLAGVDQFQVQVYTTGGSALSTAALSQVALAITRNWHEGLQWDSPNPFDPLSYNAQCMDNAVYTDSLVNLRVRIMTRLGFATTATNPPPGMGPLINDFLQSAQRYLYRRYKQLHTTRLFRWKVNPGQRFYSLLDNDEDVLCTNFNMDPNKRIEWAGIQDSRNVWYPLVQGIQPQLYTMINKPWRPARYEIRQAIEVYPMPDQTYWMWFKGHFGLMVFASDSDQTTLDAELVFLWALANAKAHYGQPDANNIAAQANDYRKELIAGTHQTASYIPGTISVPPAVRPTLIQFQGNTGG